MTILKIQEILQARLLTPHVDLVKEVFSAGGSDMMSDVLAHVKNQAMLITGLNNPQVVRTADMMDMACVVFVREKEPSEEIVKLADERGVAILLIEIAMFPTCVILYETELRGAS